MTVKLFFKCKKQLYIIFSLIKLTKDDYCAPSLLFLFNRTLCSFIKMPRMTENEPNDFFHFYQFYFYILNERKLIALHAIF